MVAAEVSPVMSVTIYALLDPDSGEVRYVGQTKNVWTRYGSHLMTVKGSAAKQGWFRELQQRQQLPVLKILEQSVTLSDSVEREQHWIAYYHGEGARLVNVALIPKPPPKPPSRPQLPPGPHESLQERLIQHGMQTIAEFTHGRDCPSNTGGCSGMAK